MLAVNVVGIVACLVAAGALWWTYERVRDIPVIALGDQLAPVDEGGEGGAGADGVGAADSDTADSDDTGNGVRNFLIVGTDSAAGLDPDDPAAQGRPPATLADTMMVLRVDPASERAALLSLPRDLYLPIAGHGGSARLNSAIQGGPAALIETIGDALGVPVNHYVQIDFAGFQELVDAVDGVPVYFGEPVRDRRSGLSVPVAGCTTLDPDQALAFVRARTYEVELDGRWEVDGSGDLGRISRQQDFIRRVLQRAIQRGARNPAVLRDLVEIAFDRVIVDDGLALGDVLALGDRFRSFEPADLDLYTLAVYDEVVQGSEVLRLDAVRAQATLDVFRSDSGERGSVVLQVLNGTGGPDAATDAAAALAEVGFVVPPGNTGDAQSFDYARTTVLYLAGAEAEAALVASHLGADPVVEEGPFIVGARVAVIIGDDWAGVVAEPRDIAPGLVASTTTTTTATTSTTGPDLDGGAPAASTTTTERVGEVPRAPDGSTC